MNMETLEKANKLNREIGENTEILETINFLCDCCAKIELTDFNHSSVVIPKNLVPVIKHLLCGYYNGICEDLKSEIEKL